MQAGPAFQLSSVLPYPVSKKYVVQGGSLLAVQRPEEKNRLRLEVPIQRQAKYYTVMPRCAAPFVDHWMS